jgi:hypothetical protein
LLAIIGLIRLQAGSYTSIETPDGDGIGVRVGAAVGARRAAIDPRRAQQSRRPQRGVR